MAIKYLGDALYKGLSSDTKPTTAAANAVFFETDTRSHYYYSGGEWLVPETSLANPESPYTWFIYKSGSNYKAKNGILGTVPTAGISTSMSGPTGTWTYIRDNFNIAGEETPYGGVVSFGRGTFDFTDELLIDSTINGGGAGYGLTVQGIKSSTLIRFQPSSPITAGFHVKSVTATTIRDLTMQSNDNVTNAIWLDASVTHTDYTLLDNLRLLKIGTLQNAGSVGLLIKQQNSGAFGMHHTQLRTTHIKDYETHIDIISLGNASALSFDKLFLWRPRYGIRGDEQASFNTFSNIIVQADASTTEYGLSIKGKYNTISNIVADALAPPFTVVILEPGSGYNKVSGVSNSGTGATVVDLSGAITNNVIDRVSFRVPGTAKAGSWQGSVTPAGTWNCDGILAGGFTQFNNNSVNPGTFTHNVFSSANTNGTNMTTSASANCRMGICSNVKVVARFQDPRLWGGLAFGSVTTSKRWFIGLIATALSDTALPTALDTAMPLTATQLIGIGQRSSDTTAYCIHNDSSGDPVFDQLLDANNDPITVVGTGSPYLRFSIFVNHINSSTVNAYVGYENNKANVFTSNLPSQDTELFLAAYVETTNTTQKVMGLRQLRLETRN